MLHLYYENAKYSAGLAYSVHQSHSKVAYLSRVDFWWDRLYCQCSKESF